jgi:hypothetical protein
VEVRQTRTGDLRNVCSRHIRVSRCSRKIMTGNGLSPCCGREPTLRVKPNLRHTALWDVEFTCPMCGFCNGRSYNEDEARRFWEEATEPHGASDRTAGASG